MAEQRRRIDPQVGAVQTAQPDQRHDRGRNRDHQRRERKNQRRERIHAAQEHVMSPNHVAEEADAHHAVDDGLGAQHRLAHVADQDVADDADRRKNRDVDLWMAEEPEQVLPEQRRTSLVRLQVVADVQARWNEEARSRHAIQNQQQAGGHAERRKPAARCKK